MFKALIYSDVHYCQNSSIVRKRGDRFSCRLMNLNKSISWAEKLALDLHCDKIICAGDFFDRSDLNAEEITALQEIEFANIPHIFLTGNHEANVASLDFSSANVFKSFDAEIITEATSISVSDDVDIYFIPYITDQDKMSLCNYIKNDSKKKIIITHNDIAGIQYGRFTSTSGFDVKDILSNCSLFIDGHLHNSCVINDRIILIGNLTGLNFNESADKYEHYAFILTVDGPDITLEPVVNPHAYNFYKLYINFESDLDKLYKLKNNAVLSVTCRSELMGKANDILSELSNIVEYRLLSAYIGSAKTEGTLELNSEDPLQQFKTFVQMKLGASDLLTDELSNLI